MTSSGRLLYNKRHAKKIERWKNVLKDYVTKTLTFLQMPGKAQKARGKHEPPPAAGQEDRAAGAAFLEDGAAAEPVETDFDPEALFAAAPTTEEALDASPADAPEESIPGQSSFEAGLRFCENRDYPQALEALTQAAGMGHMQAQFLCGQLYRQGVAAGPDHKLALAWYKRSAKQGFVEAQLACGAMYEEGCGTAVNMKRALGWYEQAAKQGSLKAQLKCGRMYYCGRAETRNPKKARYWLEIAAEGGSEEAKQLLSQRF